MNITHTSRLNIRQVQAQDKACLALILSEPKIMRFSASGIHSEDDIAQYIKSCENQYVEYGFGRWVAFAKSNGEFIGTCGLNAHIVDGEELVHLTYRVVLDRQGQGYATEMAKGVLEYAKNQLKLKHVYAIIEPDNLNSLHVAKKAGFKFIRNTKFLNIDVGVYQI